MPTANANEFRLDGMPSDPTLVRGLLAETADPVWMIAVQMALGEMQAVDGGSPASAVLTSQASPLTRWLPHLPDGSAGACLGGLGAAGCAGGDSAPLEAILENEQQPSSRDIPSARLAAVAGRQYLRLLPAADTKQTIAKYRAALVTKYRLLQPDQPDVDDPLIALALGREIDGQALYRDLDQSVRKEQPATLPAQPAVAAGDVATVTAAAVRFLAWYDAVSGATLPDSSAWTPDRFEYQLSVGARTEDGELVLAASEFDSGKLDWHDFDIAAGATLDAIADAPPNEPDTATYLPAPVRFHGASGAGHWTFEDASVEIGAVQAGPEDLATMVAVDFAVRYSNDFFMIPLPLSVGSVTRVTSLTVTDTFGQTIVVPRVNQPGEPLRLFEHTVQDSDERDSAMLLFPALAGALDATPFETVVFLRDEIGDICWAVEQTVLGNTGESIDRSAQLAQQQPAPVPAAIPDDGMSDTMKYQLRATLAANWYPVTASDGNPTLLEVGKLAPLPGQNPQPVPTTRVLTELVGINVPGEEVTRDGLLVSRRWRFARGHDGTQYLWIARSAVPAPVVAIPDLGFDQAVAETA